MDNQRLGRLERVPLREVWGHESLDFTPWLAENLEELNRSLRVDLLEPRTEVEVGRFKADIVARTTTGGVAVIENQLTPADHTHLGQLLTYLADQADPSVGIWIAERFRSEHRRALVWLNQSTPHGMDFYGVELAALRRVGEQDSAPWFTPVAYPDDWESIGSRQSRDLPGSAEYREFFAQLINDLTSREEVRITSERREARRLIWPSDDDRISFRAQFLARGKVGVSVILDAGSDEATAQMYRRLLKERSRIESDLGETLQWEEQPQRRTSIVRMRRPGDIHDSAEALNEVREWMRQSLFELRETFGRYLARASV